MRISLPNNWEPREYQLPLWSYLEGGGTRAAAVWHRRAGKDDVCLHWAAIAAHQRQANYWHMLPEASQARKAIWEAINPHTGKRRIDEAFPLALRETTREQEMLIKFKNGSTWQVVGSDNYNSLIGSPPAGVVFSEWSVANPSSWAYLRPILAENGGWALFIYTPRGANHGKSTYDMATKQDKWFAQRLTVDETNVFSPELLQGEKEEYLEMYGKDQGEAFFNQEYYCSFHAAVMGAYYAAEMVKAEKQGRITGVPYEPKCPVITAWDLGIDDSTAIWFAQVVGREIHIIDYYESSGVGLEHYAKVLKEKDYYYGEHLLPHDVEVRELGTGTSRLETLKSLGIKCRVVPNQSLADGINAARMIIPKCWFDRDLEGLEALRLYRREWNDKTKTFRQHPLHDWTSHAADAFRYLAVGLRGNKVKKPFKQPKVAVV